ncbi:MAG: hypothetical protein LAP13_13290 [Acidobacteriia bacterium]|nr:hypothetical protein [Terriglobia bacterium]
MKPIEEELRAALRKQEPPEGFAARVLARVNTRPTPQTAWWAPLRAFVRSPRWRWVAAAVAACLLLVAAVVYHRREQRMEAQGEMAKAQVMKALRIASVKLNIARRKVQEIDRSGPQS